MGYRKLWRVTEDYLESLGLLRVTEGYMGYGELQRVT